LEDHDEAAAKEKALAEHIAAHPKDAGRTVKDFNWVVHEIVHPKFIIAADDSVRWPDETIEEGPRANSRTPIRTPMALPRRSSPLICRRLTLVASLARSHGDPCINVLLGISADRRGRNGNDDPARPR
jgi:hypothetical protein